MMLLSICCRTMLGLTIVPEVGRHHHAVHLDRLAAATETSATCAMEVP